MDLTLKQKTNLFHILFIFPLIYVNLYPEILGDKDKALYLHHLLLFLVIVGTLYHIYRFMYASKLVE